MFNLPAIKELCEAAQDGPWESQPHQELAEAGNFFTRWDIITQQKRLVVKGIYGSDDAEFIAQARTLVPQLVEALEEAQAENARLQTELKMARACDSDALMVSELACLQARVEEAEVHDCGYALTRVLEIAERQLALAERRKEALEATGNDLARLHDGDVSNYGLEIRAMLRRANAAIALTLETARAAIEEEEK